MIHALPLPILNKLWKNPSLQASVMMNNIYIPHKKYYLHGDEVFMSFFMVNMAWQNQGMNTDIAR